MKNTFRIISFVGMGKLVQIDQNLLLYDGQFFDKGYTSIIGADEVGRGPLAGPVMAGAVWIDHNFYNEYCQNKEIFLFQDSKQLTEKQRLEAFQVLQDLSQKTSLKFAVGEASVSEIDVGNILYATTLAFRRALENLQKIANITLPKIEDLTNFPKHNTVYIIVDGYRLKRLPYQHTWLVKGDRTSFCIAAASIIAKVVRDGKMLELAKQFPQYHFEENKGYGTEAHISALKQYGPCEIHRKSFLHKILHPKSHNAPQLNLPLQ